MDNYLDLFLWVSHGNNVSSKNNYYPMEIPFQTVNIYSSPFKTTYKEDLLEIHSNPCEFISGKCPSVPIINKQTGKKYVYLPPLVFNCYESESDTDVKNFSGLYYAKVKMLPRENMDPTQPNSYLKKCILQPSKLESYDRTQTYANFHKFLGHDEIIAKYGSGTNITYSQIFKLVKYYCENADFSFYRNENEMVTDALSVDPSKAILGIFSCQSLSGEYAVNYEQNVLNLVPKAVESVNEVNVYSSISLIPSFSKKIIFPLVIHKRTNESYGDEWTALAKLKHQGCGLNALSYIDAIPKNEARERAVCLDIKGTSIFKIVDNLDVILKSVGVNSSGYLILRYYLIHGCNIVQYILHNYFSKFNNNIYMIIKMYDTYQISSTNPEPSHVGHTIIFGKENGIYKLIDPQRSLKLDLIFENMSVDNGYIGTIVNSKYPNIQFIDIAFGLFDVANNSEQLFNMTTIVLNNLQNNLAGIIPRPTNITYGGKKRCRKNRKNKTCKKGQKSKQSKKYRKRRQSRKYVGGSVDEIINNDKLDDFEKFMLYTDEKNNIPTVLNTTDI
jgi:hypothetical protein